MGMKRDANGALCPAPGYLKEQINNFPELKNKVMPEIEVIESPELKDSSAAGPEDWIELARNIALNYFEYDGFVVIMGTDTMAYAASALSFMLENLAKPVIFTGSAIPFYEVHSDARRNLLISIIFASEYNKFNEVCLFFNENLYRGNRATKVNTMSMRAFDSPNFPPLATVGVSIHAAPGYVCKSPEGAFKIHDKLDSRVFVIRMIPGMDIEVPCLILSSSNNKGVVLEMFGAGNGPPRPQLIAAIKAAVEKGVIVVAVSQCLVGGVDLSMYSLGVAYRDAGVVNGGDMTTAACITKLAFLLSKNPDNPQMVRELMAQNLREEMSTDVDRKKNAPYFERSLVY